MVLPASRGHRQAHSPSPSPQNQPGDRPSLSRGPITVAWGVESESKRCREGAGREKQRVQAASGNTHRLHLPGTLALQSQAPEGTPVFPKQRGNKCKLQNYGARSLPGFCLTWPTRCTFVSLDQQWQDWVPMAPSSCPGLSLGHHKIHLAAPKK